jgi:pyrroline-5-carboxylate reductase
MAAGISSQNVSDAANGAAVVRVMPNTPMLIGKGVIAVCRNEKVSDSDFEYICDVFSSSGSVIKIDESEMNRIIAVTGSSPAYVFMMIKAMYEGAVAQGLLENRLSEKDLTNAICDTIIGAAELMKQGTKTPDEQISTVASKGGTTERAIAELESYHFCEAIISAMDKCTKRADELGSSNK